MVVPPLHRILLVEDDLDIQRMVRLALEEVGGFEIEVCSSGLEAIARAPRFRPELVLLDVMMPEMDGPATLRGLARLPELAATPVVFMTAKVQPNEIAEYRQFGAVDVIVKPFDPLLLPDAIRAIWQRVHAG